MEDKAGELSERFLDYAVLIVRMCVQLNRTAIGRHIGNQLLRSGTSAGANYEEARGAESRADFLHKLQIVLKELRESLYWLRLIQRIEVLNVQNMNGAIDETSHLSNIIAKSIITAKKAK